MKKRFIIKKLIAVFILGVFALGITPKKNLHSLFANHTDDNTNSHREKQPGVSKSGFHCICDDLVAESNFIAAAPIIIAIPSAFYSAYKSYFSSFISLPSPLFNLRGPPVKFLIATFNAQ